MKTVAPLALACLIAVPVAMSAEKPVLKLWPTGLPKGAVQFSPQKIAAAKKKTTDERIAYVDDPTITLYRAPKTKANGCAIVICPGGGYNILAWPKEGLEIAEYFNTVGVTCAVLKYRVPRRVTDAPHAEPLQDAQRAIRLLRANAKDWEIDPRRVGILGFSAGGNLATMAGLHHADKTYPRVDAADDLSARPDFVCPIYPAYYADEQKPGPLSPLLTVDKKSPPTFIAVTSDDKLRGYNAAHFYAELKKHNVPAEIHVYEKGGHGYGIRPSENAVSQWHLRCTEWLGARGLLEKRL
jgi:acetyl esterase/lipase